MNQDQKNALYLNRYNKLKENVKDIKCPGVLRKLKRYFIKNNIAF